MQKAHHLQCYQGKENIFTLRTCTRGKVIDSVVIVVNKKVARSQHLGSLQLVITTDLLNLAKHWPHCASNRVAWPTRITNSIILLAIVATPLNCAYY